MMLRIAVISDLHVFDGSSSSDNSPSYVGTADPHEGIEKYPFAGLKNLIETENLSADLLICPGDMTNQASASALNYAWAKLHDLKGWLKASQFIATNGNHDIDSRHMNSDFDPKGAIQSLRPMFPGVTEPECDRYWSRNFVVIEHNEARIVLLNSAAFHGYGKDQAKEFEQGRISAPTLAALKAEIPKKDGQVNILVCHHHPLRLNGIEEEDYSEMQGGSALLEMLTSLDLGQWLIIHGHKHFPKLAYGPGDASSPVIFSAGSFSVTLHSRAAAHARNQFYIIEVPVDKLGELGLDLAGKVQAWDWINLKGWQPAGKESGLPRKSGFGWRESTTAIAKDIAAILSTTDTFMKWTEVAEKIPRIDYLMPKNKEELIKKLKENHSIKCSPDIDTGEIDELGYSK